MTFVPPDPSKTLKQLRDSLAQIRELAALDRNSAAYLDVVADIETAVKKLEAILKKAS